jgi:hypothetical protein
VNRVSDAMQDTLLTSRIAPIVDPGTDPAAGGPNAGAGAIPRQPRSRSRLRLRLRRRLPWRAVAVVAAVALVAAGAAAIRERRSLLPVGRSQFAADTAAVSGSAAAYRARGTTVVANADGTAHYLNETFDGYGGVNSLLVDGMETAKRLRQTGGSGQPVPNPDAMEGRRSAAVRLAEGGTPVTVRGELPHPVDLSRWTDGYATMWMRVADRAGISGVTVTLGDTAGATRRLALLPNLQTDYPNFPTINDPFPDLRYPEPTYAAEWTDYQLVRGWNLLLWRMGQGTTQSGPEFNLGAVAWYEISIATTGALSDQRLLLDDLRVADGLQSAANPVGGAWHPPLGMPQYGVFDVSPVGSATSGDYALHLLNVRQSQYPSNGDHGRMLSAYGTPMNFAFRTRFSLDRLGKGGSLDNTWLRVLYDFDPDYDPGHDWYGGYLSLDYQRAGLLTVIPLERFSTQAQEPKQTGRITSYRKAFEPEAGAVYEYDMTVRGQRTTVTIYQVRGGRLYRMVDVAYTFDRPRRTDKRFPFGLEITGNVNATIYSVELVEL